MTQAVRLLLQKKEMQLNLERDGLSTYMNALLQTKNLTGLSTVLQRLEVLKANLEVLSEISAGLDDVDLLTKIDSLELPKEVQA